MLIRVICETGTFDYVKETRLDDLIATNKILGFCRSDGWAIIGKHPIRTGSSSEYNGLERRA